jgi:hypothetical protein
MGVSVEKKLLAGCHECITIPLSVVVQPVWYLVYHLELHARELTDKRDVQVTAMLASASTFKGVEAPFQRDETARRVLQSQHFSSIECRVIGTPESRDKKSRH